MGYIMNDENENITLIEKRGQICDSCPKKSFIVCSECGCVIWAKIRLEKEKCPLGKW